MQITLVVRRFGPVGGMESYVFQLAQTLQQRGHAITVLCEQICSAVPVGITAHALGAQRPRPRWLALWRFGQRVERWLRDHPEPGRIVHSHERLGCHHVTTWHGSVFATVFDKPWWYRWSLRVWMHLYLEQRELRVARQVVPVSYVTAQQIADWYPSLLMRLTTPVLPAVQSPAQRPERLVPEDGGVIGFVGREWQRKGLQNAVTIVQALRQQRPRLQLCVVGVPAHEVATVLAPLEGCVQCIPWGEKVPYEQFDVLLHPAQSEPFGMVVTEAMAAGVPVVVSNACGAAQEVKAASGTVLDLRQPVSEWASAVELQLLRTKPVPPYVRSWEQVALEYETLYQQMTDCRAQSHEGSGFALTNFPLTR
ncbi:glycosyltransferase family 4 protein [Curvibacter sp. CHRR-16]|uniref:glycosyltransferase family 4 protein n=1 Tax=Curvibacter sp. CHRR-16 TaxID=2835872 RepID=UPI001BDAF864|nr:glycosyltransferase family 4 protein [Curvibacter sp. CHRR-16]MBT0569347.1 glycosyltransferase family 4 protein [Curvibacter sp. CHRR-16]